MQPYLKKSAFAELFSSLTDLGYVYVFILKIGKYDLSSNGEKRKILHSGTLFAGCAATRIFKRILKMQEMINSLKIRNNTTC